MIGGTFQNIPLCTSVSETGCVIAYRSYEENHAPVGGSNNVTGPGMDNACTNPGALGGGESTHFARFQNFYAGECVPDDIGHSYLQIRMRLQPGDLRTNPIDFDHPTLSPAGLGTHIIDYAFTLGQLKSLVAAKAAAIP